MVDFVANNALMLILAVAGFWFTMRFVIGPQRGAPGLASLFAREKPVRMSGLGRSAIATLLDDTRKFVTNAPDLRALVLAGPFAVDSATSHSSVTLVILCETTEPYGGKVWLAHWPYPMRGHPILEHRIESSGADVLHLLSLRGAPKLRLHFVSMHAIVPPASLVDALREGTRTLDDPSGIGEKLRVHWVDQTRLPAN